MPGSREIKRRIRSISNTKKITRAMQMVSAAKMRRAQMAVVASRPYAEQAKALAARVQSEGAGRMDSIDRPDDQFEFDPYGSVLKKSAPKLVGLIVITPNRGQVGALNTNVVNAARDFMRSARALGKDVSVMVMGKKARDGMLALGNTLEADFLKSDKVVRVEDIRPLAQFISELFDSGQFSEVHIAYPKFISTLSQKAVVEQLLPYTMQVVDETHKPADHSLSQDYVFEPSKSEVLEALLPRITEAQVFKALLEANASEHSARMVMMKNATEAAGDLVDELKLSYNRLRQAGITNELAEITAGRIAME